MKKVIFAAALLISSQLFAQQTPKNKTLLRHKMESTGYGALTTSYSRFNGQHALFTGFHGGWMIDHKLMIGIGGYGLTTQHKGFGLNAETHRQNNLRMGYGGLMLEYTLLGNNLIHASASTLLGGGIIKNGYGRGRNHYNGSDELADIDASGFYAIQPALNVEVNVTDWFRVAIGGGYRFIGAVDLEGITNKKMSAPTANVSLKFGVF